MGIWPGQGSQKREETIEWKSEGSRIKGKKGGYKQSNLHVHRPNGSMMWGLQRTKRKPSGEARENKVSV